MLRAALNTNIAIRTIDNLLRYSKENGIRHKFSRLFDNNSIMCTKRYIEQ